MKKITLLAAMFAAFAMNAQLIDEGFDDITTLTDYTVVNVSDSPNTDIFQGNDTVFPAFDGDPTSYLGMNFNATAGTLIDLYLISPTLMLQNGDIITFYTRTGTGSTFPDRLEVRLDVDGSGTLPTSGDVGSYTGLLLEINPGLTQGGYPETWEPQQSVVVSGLPAGETATTFAFRYWVTDAGPTGANSNYIGIDRLVVEEGLSVGDETFQGFNYFVDANNGLNLKANAPIQTVALYNILGQEVIAQKLNTTNAVVDMASLKSGVYIATVTIDGASKSFKVIKK
ncbi:choice-of-anchor J domain-containing protein [uncultured Altibacter sp.]|uniref:T9SS-dependent choice-of-anchor J family protein n=3 Tax=Altibacter TaxID=1535231 RepID=UPI0030DC84AC|tara:strand:+ start:245 stop:1096 length:852 start_codon:yes stop_codon:yes gene_type:complete